MRTLVIALALTLAAACNPSTPPAEQQTAAEPAAPPSAANPDTLALQGPLATGQWFERADGGTFSAGFGEPESEFQFGIMCIAGSGAITVMSGAELAPDQATTIRLITSTQSLELPAQSHNEGLPSITAEIADAAPAHMPLISMMGAPSDRFAVEAAGAIVVYPWDDSISRTLIACR